MAEQPSNTELSSCSSGKCALRAMQLEMVFQQTVRQRERPGCGNIGKQNLTDFLVKEEVKSISRSGLPQSEAHVFRWWWCSWQNILYTYYIPLKTVTSFTHSIPEV